MAARWRPTASPAPSSPRVAPAPSNASVAPNDRVCRLKLLWYRPASWRTGPCNWKNASSTSTTDAYVASGVNLTAGGKLNVTARGAATLAANDASVQVQDDIDALITLSQTMEEQLKEMRRQSSSMPAESAIYVAEIEDLIVSVSTERLEALQHTNPDEYREYAEELAEKLAMPLEKVRKVMKIAKEPISLETPIGDEEDSHLGDFIEDKNAILPIDAAIQSNLRETTTRVLASLTPREERVLRMRFGIGMNTDHTLEEVGQQFSVTRERIRQIEQKALQKLRKAMTHEATTENR